MAWLAPIEGIAPRGPAVSLLRVARELPAGTDWKAGIAFRESSRALTQRWPMCPEPEQPDKVVADAVLAEFWPFAIYVAMVCEESAVVPASAEALTSEARAQFDAASAWPVARELWTGETDPMVGESNPSLQSEAQVVAGPLGPVAALAALLAAFEECNHTGMPTVHAPIPVVTHLLHQGVINQQGAVYYGPNCIVSPGPGYPTGAGNWGPFTEGDPNGLNAAATQAFMYATGPVEYAIGNEIVPLEGEPAAKQNLRTNLWHVYVERLAIVRFDPSCVFGVLVDLPQNV